MDTAMPPNIDVVSEFHAKPADENMTPAMASEAAAGPIGLIAAAAITSPHPSRSKT
jgi:hypothetical protein